jgi:MFS transporter, DHA1 family, multidrug resistance protein
MLRPETFAMTAVLALLTGLGPLSVDMYLASFPDMVRTLPAPASQVQLTISVYLLGFAVGQVLYGPLSDRHGRRPVLLAALSVYLLATLVCVLAPSIGVLIGARFFQAVGASGSIVLARAMVRDLYEGARVARELSRLATIIAIAPISAPLIGGVLQTLFGWRSNFVGLFLIGSIAAFCVLFLLPETLRRRAPERVSLLSVLRSYRDFLANRSYLAYLALGTCCFVGLFAWISAAAFVLQDIYQLSALMFGVGFAMCSAGYMLGTAIAARFVTRWGVGLTVGFGSAAMAAGGIAMVATVALGLASAIVLFLTMALYLAGMGMVLPQSQAGALLPFPDRAGAASSLLGLVQQTAAAVTGAILGHQIGFTAWPLALAVAFAGCAALALWAATRTARSRGV